MSKTKEQSSAKPKKVASAKAASSSKPKANKSSSKSLKAVDKASASSSKVKKSTIHNNYREISVEMTDGTIFKTYSTYSSDILKLDVDTKTHPAWTKEANYINTQSSAVAKFNSRFSGLSFVSKKS